MLNDQLKWDQLHARGGGPEDAAELLRYVIESGHWPIASGRALDIACGKGRNACYLAQKGFAVTGLDISPVALAEAQRNAIARSLQIDWQQADLENHRLAENGFDFIVNVNYLQRSLLPQIKRALKIGGAVVFETYLIDQQRVGHPKNPDYLLRHNELIKSFSDFRVHYYREGEFGDGPARSFRAGIFARKLD